MSEFVPMNLKDITAIAAKKGCEVVISMDDELQFDLDTAESQLRFATFLGWIESHYPQKYTVSGWTSSGGNQHRVVKGQPFAVMSIEAKIALQAMGGSDGRREYAALHCYWAGSPHPVLLFRPLFELKEENHA